MIPKDLLETLYSMGAEAVLTITEAEKAKLVAHFPQQTKPLTLTLLPGNYLIMRVSEAPGAAPGLQTVTNPARE